MYRVLHDTNPLRAYAGWLLVILGALAVALVALGPAGAQEGEELSNPVAFAETSYANVCAECHGDAGEGGVVPDTDRRAPALTGTEEVTAAYVDLVLRTGRMPPAGDPFDNRAREVFYSEAERQAMVAWLTETFGLEQDIPDVAEGDVAVGLETFALNCAHCHGNAGAGGTAGSTAWTPRVNQLEPIAIVEAIRVGPFEMPAFATDQLTEDEADAVASYLEAVREESGTPVFGLVELNPVFASGFVGLLAVLLVGSLLYVGSRPAPFESVPGAALHASRPPTGMTPMPGDPRYEAMERDLPHDQDREPIPYTDEQDVDPTEGSTKAEVADTEDADTEDATSDPSTDDSPPHEEPPAP